jgi:hypothetical protein
MYKVPIKAVKLGSGSLKSYTLAYSTLRISVIGHFKQIKGFDRLTHVTGRTLLVFVRH